MVTPVPRWISSRGPKYFSMRSIAVPRSRRLASRVPLRTSFANPPRMRSSEDFCLDNCSPNVTCVPEPGGLAARSLLNFRCWLRGRQIEALFLALFWLGRGLRRSGLHRHPCRMLGSEEFSLALFKLFCGAFREPRFGTIPGILDFAPQGPDRPPELLPNVSL